MGVRGRVGEKWEDRGRDGHGDSGVAGGGAMGRSAPDGTFRGAVKLRLYLKIWLGEKYFEGEKFY